MESSPGSRSRVRVLDVADDVHLICYAARAQVELLKSGRLRPGKVNQDTVAVMMRAGKTNLNKALRSGMSPALMRRFDGAVMALAPELARTGGLVALNVRLQGWEGS
jgi:hypothetical protein